jgi:hypothetical protein
MRTFTIKDEYYEELVYPNLVTGYPTPEFSYSSNNQATTTLQPSHPTRNACCGGGH